MVQLFLKTEQLRGLIVLLLLCDYYNPGYLDKVDQSDDREITIQWNPALRPDLRATLYRATFFACLTKAAIHFLVKNKQNPR